MKHELNFWVIGGDRRQSSLAALLAEDGHTVHTYALPAPAAPGVYGEVELKGLHLADCVIFPLPAASSAGMLNAPLSPAPCPLSPILEALTPGQFLCGGRVDSGTKALAEEKNLRILDYFAREELQIANAVPTAEGAVQIALERLPITVHGAKALVVGFGRVGRLTAQTLGALGAKVSVAARRYDQLAWGKAMGFGTEHISQLSGWLCGYDLIVNTVPAAILGERELEDLKPECLIIDLASAPGGVDREAAERLGLQVVWALSLPGKVAPVTAGAAIKSSVYHMLQERGY